MVTVSSELVLRPLTSFDAPFLLELITDSTVQNMTVGFPSDPSENTVLSMIKMRENWLKNGTGWQLAIDYKGHFIGLVGLNAISKAYDRASLDYVISSAYRNRGIATSAVQAFIPVAAQRFSLHRISALTFADNAPSRRVLEKSGFSLEGIARDEIKKNGIYRDTAHYGLIV